MQSPMIAQSLTHRFPHLHIFTFAHLHIPTFTHLHIFTSTHPHIRFNKKAVTLVTAFLLSQYA